MIQLANRAIVFSKKIVLLIKAFALLLALCNGDVKLTLNSYCIFFISVLSPDSEHFNAKYSLSGMAEKVSLLILMIRKAVSLINHTI